MARPAEALNDRGGGLSRSKRNDDAFATPAAHLCRANDGVRGVVSTLDDDVGPEVAHELQWSVLVEDNDSIDRLESAEDVGSFRFRPDRTVGALEPPNAGVAVQADDKGVAALARSAKDMDVARVQEIEYAVCEDDSSAASSAPRVRILPVEHLPRRIEGAQKLLSTRGWK
jgi:hypothetical protein